MMAPPPPHGRQLIGKHREKNLWEFQRDYRGFHRVLTKHRTLLNIHNRLLDEHHFHHRLHHRLNKPNNMNLSHIPTIQTTRTLSLRRLLLQKRRHMFKPYVNTAPIFWEHTERPNEGRKIMARLPNGNFGPTRFVLWHNQCWLIWPIFIQ